MITQTGIVLVEEADYKNLPKQITEGSKICRVVRIQRKPYLGVLKLHKTFRVK